MDDNEDELLLQDWGGAFEIREKAQMKDHTDSDPVIDNDVRVVRRGAKDVRYVKGRVGARTEHKPEFADVSLWHDSPNGRRYTLFLPLDQAQNLADALDALLADLDPDGPGVDPLDYEEG